MISAQELRTLIAADKEAEAEASRRGQLDREARKEARRAELVKDKLPETLKFIEHELLRRRSGPFNWFAFEGEWFTFGDDAEILCEEVYKALLPLGYELALGVDAEGDHEFRNHRIKHSVWICWAEPQMIQVVEEPVEEPAEESLRWPKRLSRRFS